MKRKPKNPGESGETCTLSPSCPCYSCVVWSKDRRKATAGARIAFRFDADEIPGGLCPDKIDRLAKAIDRTVRRAFKDGKKATSTDKGFGPLSAKYRVLHAKYGVKP